MKTIFLVDDHPIMRHGLAQLICAESDLNVVGEAGTAQEAITKVVQTNPDLIILDLTLPDMHGLELAKELRILRPDSFLLVLSMHDEALYVERIFRAGAQGYLMKETAAEHLIFAIRKVLEGGVYVSDKMASLLLQGLAGMRKSNSGNLIDNLSDRELEILHLIGSGKNSKSIASQLNISVRTVDAHRAHIKDKLKLPDGNSLVFYAMRWVESKQ